MRKLSCGKVLAVCLSVVMVLSLIPNGRIFAAGEKEKTEKETSSVVDASTLNVQVDFYDYSITKYKNKPVDETAKIALNAYQLEKFASENTVSGSAVFLFGGDRTTDQTGPQNVWTTRYHKSLYQGIVEKQLDPNGNLVFNNKNNVYSVNIFPQEGDNTLEDTGVVETYYNTNFQFLNEDGTYQFDSTKHAAYGLGKGGDG